MNLTPIRCPTCDAPITLDPGSLEGHCAYCGQHCVLECTPDRASTKLANQVEELIAPLSELTVLGDAFEALSAQLAQLQERAQERAKRSLKGMAKAYGVLALVLVWSMANGAGPAFWLPVGIGVIPILAMIRRVDMAELRKSVTSKKKECAAVKEEIRRLRASYDFEIIPENYLNKDALQFFHRALKNQRATTIQQAIDLYEDVLHKIRVEKLLEEQITLQRQHLAQSQEADEDSAREVGGSGLGKALVTGGALLGIAALLRRNDGDDE